MLLKEGWCSLVWTLCSKPDWWTWILDSFWKQKLVFLAIWKNNPIFRPLMEMFTAQCPASQELGWLFMAPQCVRIIIYSLTHEMRVPTTRDSPNLLSKAHLHPQVQAFECPLPSMVCRITHLQVSASACAFASSNDGKTSEASGCKGVEGTRQREPPLMATPLPGHLAISCKFNPAHKCEE